MYLVADWVSNCNVQEATQPVVRFNVAKDEKLTGGNEFQTFMNDSLNENILSYTARTLWLI